METYKGLFIPETKILRYAEKYNFYYCAEALCHGRSVDCDNCLFHKENEEIFNEWNKPEPSQQEINTELAIRTESQNKSILEHLRAGNHINIEIIPDQIKCKRLASRICDIRKVLSDNEKIESKMIKNTNVYIKDYWLEKI